MSALFAILFWIGVVGVLLCGIENIVKARVFSRTNKRQAVEHYQARWKTHG